MTDKKKILSGNRPTGNLHLGHLVGILENWASLQDDYHCFFEVADWHVLTTAQHNLPAMDRNIREMVAGWLSTGIDPEKSVIFMQSQVPEHAELHLLLSMITTVSRLERNPTYKEQLEELDLERGVSYGLLGYPVLQAADILIYRASAVPIGQDQLPHLELTREIARRFNHLFDEVFYEPEPLLTRVPKLAGTDGRKMSNSYDNAIYISDTKEEIREKVKQMVTDPGRVRLKDKGTPEVCSIYDYHHVFNNPGFYQQVGPACRQAEIGCTECKERLASTLDQHLAPIRDRRARLLADGDRIDEILRAGTIKARREAGETMELVRDVMKIYRPGS